MKTHVIPVSDHLLTFPTLPLSDHQPVLPECQPVIAQACMMNKHTPLRGSHPFPHLALIYFATKKCLKSQHFPFALTFPLLAQICRS